MARAIGHDPQVVVDTGDIATSERGDHEDEQQRREAHTDQAREDGADKDLFGATRVTKALVGWRLIAMLTKSAATVTVALATCQVTATAGPEHIGQ